MERLLGSWTAPGPCVLEPRPKSAPVSVATDEGVFANASAPPENRRVMLPAAGAPVLVSHELHSNGHHP